MRDHIDCDLLALRDLVLTCDSARTEQIPLLEINLQSDRTFTQILGQHVRAGYAFNLIGFVVDDPRALSNTLNTLEFCLKFKQALSNGSAPFGETISQSASRASSAYVPPHEENVL